MSASKPREEQQIYISARVWHEIAYKLQVTPFIDIIREKIDLSQYGKGVRKFYYTFIAVMDDNVVNEPYEDYSIKDKSADIATSIPYEKIQNASAKEAFHLMEQAYLQGIDCLKKLPLDSVFDINAFKKDVQDIFAEKDWYKPILEKLEIEKKERDQIQEKNLKENASKTLIPTALSEYDIDLKKGGVLFMGNMLDDGLYEKANYFIFWTALMKLDLAKYGTSLSSFFVNYIIQPPENLSKPTRIEQYPGATYAEVFLVMPYTTMVEADQNETVRLMEEALLQGVDMLSELALEDFDISAFRKDVEAVFSVKNWYADIAATLV